MAAGEAPGLFRPTGTSSTYHGSPVGLSKLATSALQWDLPRDGFLLWFSFQGRPSVRLLPLRERCRDWESSLYRGQFLTLCFFKALVRQFTTSVSWTPRALNFFVHESRTPWRKNSDPVKAKKALGSENELQEFYAWSVRASLTSPHRLLFFKLNHPNSFNVSSEAFSNHLNIFITPIWAVWNITHSGGKNNCWRRVRTFGFTSHQTTHLTSLTLRSLECKMETSLPCLSQKLLRWKYLVCARCTLCVQNTWFARSTRQN